MRRYSSTGAGCAILAIAAIVALAIFLVTPIVWLYVMAIRDFWF